MQYSQNKLQKVNSAVQKRLELISRVPLPEATTDESEIIPVPQLKEKLSSTNLRSKKLTILTVLSQSWSLPKIQEQFGVTRALHSPSSEELGTRKGIAIDPKMLRWKKFANWCQEFAHWCPGKKIVSYFLFVYLEWITTAFPNCYTCHSPWCLLN